ncbi:MAG TPA: YceI family protein [Ignavibacteriaceae bacterium]|jgi:polyisoprenoid-binding protein YceI
MKFALNSLLILVIACSNIFSQGFKVKATGEKTFSFTDKSNQAMFFSTTPLEDVTGISKQVDGTVTFNVADLKTLKGKVSIQTGSIRTGIDLRDEHLRSSNWLDADSYPEITFIIKSVSDIKQIEDNKLQAKVTGDFTAHGVTKEVKSNVTIAYLDENEKTRAIAPGDFLGVEAKFYIKLSDYNVSNVALGVRVSEDIEVTATLVGNSK